MTISQESVEELAESLKTGVLYFEQHLAPAKGQLVLVSDLYENFYGSSEHYHSVIDYRMFVILLQCFLRASNRFRPYHLNRSVLPLKTTPFRHYIQDAMFVNGKANFPVITELPTYDPNDGKNGSEPPSDRCPLLLVFCLFMCVYFVLAVLIALLYILVGGW